MPRSDIADWINGIPRISRYWFLSSIAVPLIAKLGLISGMSLILQWEPLMRFEIWRLLTCFIYYPITPMTGFHYLINLFLLYSYSTRLETEIFQGKPADMVYMLLIFAVCLLTAGLIIPLYLLMDSLLLSAIYVYCMLNPELIVTFFFGLTFQAKYLPWVLGLFRLITAGNIFNEILGIVVGHVYFFFKFKYPGELGGVEYLVTPKFLQDMFPSDTRLSGGFGNVPTRAREDDRDDNRGGTFVGRGNRLGDD